MREIWDLCHPHQRALLSLLAVSDDSNLNQASLIASLSTELTSHFGYGTFLLAEQIAAGMDSIEALEQLPGLLPPSVVLAMQVAREDGKLSQWYAAWLAQSRDQQSDIDQNRIANRVLLMYLKLSFISAVLTFMMLKIVPMFKRMFEEFGIELPFSMQLLLRLCDLAATFWFVIALLLMILAFYSVPMLQPLIRRWNPLRWRQSVPSASVNRRYDLAMLVQSGRSLKTGLTMLAEKLFPPARFDKLVQVRDRIEQGENQWAALASENVISSQEARALNLTTTGETQAWLLRWSADKRQHRQIARTTVGWRIIMGIIHIGIALIVLLACVAVFSTLIEVIKGVS